MRSASGRADGKCEGTSCRRVNLARPAQLTMSGALCRTRRRQSATAMSSRSVSDPHFWACGPSRPRPGRGSLTLRLPRLGQCRGTCAHPVVRTSKSRDLRAPFHGLLHRACPGANARVVTGAKVHSTSVFSRRTSQHKTRAALTLSGPRLREPVRHLRNSASEIVLRAPLYRVARHVESWIGRRRHIANDDPRRPVCQPGAHGGISPRMIERFDDCGGHEHARVQRGEDVFAVDPDEVIERRRVGDDDDHGRGISPLAWSRSSVSRSCSRSSTSYA